MRIACSYGFTAQHKRTLQDTRLALLNIRVAVWDDITCSRDGRTKSKYNWGSMHLPNPPIMRDPCIKEQKSRIIDTKFGNVDKTLNGYRGSYKTHGDDPIFRIITGYPAR